MTAVQIARLPTAANAKVRQPALRGHIEMATLAEMRAARDAGRTRRDQMTAQVCIDSRMGMLWWNGCSEATRARWLSASNSAIPALAWECFRRSSALPDATAMPDPITSKTLASATLAALGEIK